MTATTSTIARSPTTTASAPTSTSTTHARPAHHTTAAKPTAPYGVGEKVLTFVDHSRLVRIGGVLQPRRLVTIVRYPIAGRASRVDVLDAPPLHSAGAFPLVIFGHGFAVMPGIYDQLLQAWASAGYVVAAPIFPLENANAPGGPNEADLANQPADVSFVITQLLSSVGPFAGVLNRHAIAVTGQSDGGETALGVAYDGHFLDSRVSAAIILSGAEIPGVGGFTFPAPSPPLLATQGTADTINPPSFTDMFFDIAPPPKYLLTLFGASHLGPYTGIEPAARIVKLVTIAFLDRYLRGREDGIARMQAAGDVAGVARLTADQ